MAEPLDPPAEASLDEVLPGHYASPAQVYLRLGGVAKVRESFGHVSELTDEQVRDLVRGYILSAEGKLNTALMTAGFPYPLRPECFSSADPAHPGDAQIFAAQFMAQAVEVITAYVSNALKIAAENATEGAQERWKELEQFLADLAAHRNLLPGLPRRQVFEGVRVKGRLGRRFDAIHRRSH